MPLVPLVFGWPAVMFSVLLALIGIATSRWRLVAAGAVAASPFLLYLSLTPRFRLVAPVVAALYFGSAAVIARQLRRQVAVLMFLPFVLLSAFLAQLVVRQFR